MLTETDIRSGNLGAVRRYIEIDHGDINYRIPNTSRNLIDTAVYNRQWAIAEYLIGHGVDTNQSTANNVSLLWSALMRGAPIDLVRHMIDNGVDTSFLNNLSSKCILLILSPSNDVPTHLICERIRLLMANGVDFNRTDNNNDDTMGACVLLDKMMVLLAFLFVLKDSVDIPRLLDTAYIHSNLACLRTLIFNEITGSISMNALKSTRRAPRYRCINEYRAETCRELVDSELSRRARQKLAFVTGTRLAQGETTLRLRLNRNANQTMRLPDELVIKILDSVDVSPVRVPVF